MRIEVLVDVKTTLGEGPLWDVEEQRLYWIDSFDGRVFRCTADGREVRCLGRADEDRLDVPAPGGRGRRFACSAASISWISSRARSR